MAAPDRRAAALCLFFVSALFLGCSPERDLGELLVPDDVGTLVVDAFLVVGEPFPAIRLTRTGSPDRVYDAGNLVVDNVASMVIEKGGEPFLQYAFDPQSRFYLPVTNTIVQPETRYDLTIVTRAEEVVRASTFTPPALRVPDWVLLDDLGEDVIERFARYDEVSSPDQVYETNQVEYARGLLEAQFSRPDVAAFQVSIFSLDLDSDFVIDPDFFEEEDFEDLERIGSSPPLAGEEGRLRLPWFAIFFEGRYLVKVFAMDRNWYDLVRSTPSLGEGAPGFGGQAGDEFERPIFHVEGGIGLFGSAAVDSIGFYVLPRP